ncbi:Cleavage and polyadenylation specificity factor 100-like protein [Theobroma cacao]|uniref:Cleavage and polyadenylation specificity factor subunit 2 n=1 Tax=Theobroma cacao TaxID=3641 RepID=A0A061G1H0_THECC|nr:Cleavage and polyadenylation specificity factor 100-like protein [Theobroma cacao]
MPINHSLEKKIDYGWFCKVALRIHAVFSHPNTLHLGSPYAMKQFGPSNSIYSMELVYRLGLLTMYEMPPRTQTTSRETRGFMPQMSLRLDHMLPLLEAVGEVGLEVKLPSRPTVKVPMRGEPIPELVEFMRQWMQYPEEIMGFNSEDLDYQPYEEMDWRKVMVTLSDFMKLRPPAFNGGVDIVYLEDVTAQPLRSLRLNVTYLMYCFVSITIFIRKGEGTVNAPHLAGNLLDGTVYKITQAGEDVIYAVDFN